MTSIDILSPREATLSPEKKKDNVLVSSQTLAEMLDVGVATVRLWVHKARKNPGPEAIPFIKLPGSRFLRFPLKEVTAWYERGRI